MSVHHIAFAAKDIDATHAFYTGAMGFELVKVEVAQTEHGWAKHLFYDTDPQANRSEPSERSVRPAGGGGSLLAFWDIHDESIPEGWSPAISTGLGLPQFMNHLAFGADDLDDIGRRTARLHDHGHDVIEIDHGWCTSIYATDPNGILVEFCTTTKAFTDQDKEDAARLLADQSPPVTPAPDFKVHKAARDAATAPA
jgi:catechol 2,3-dioxygenase-like lactoylglutathione lyase family enzyme